MGNSEDLTQPPPFIASIASMQRGTLGALAEAVQRPTAALMWDYVDAGILVRMISALTHRALDRAIEKGSHVYACPPEMMALIRREMRNRMQDFSSILLPAADAVRLFGYKLKLSHIYAVPQ